MKKITVCLLLVFFCSTILCAQKSAIYIKDKSAIGGFDPVAYFTDSAAVKGKGEYAYSWGGASWLFSNKENLGLFKRAPEKYAPQFGGYCAFGAAEGHKAPTDPGAWTILDGKLYLNYNKNVQQLWNTDRNGNIKKAEGNWEVLKDKE